MTIKMTGFDELQNHLKQMQKRIKEVEGTHEVGADELFTDHFMRTYTQFESLEAFFDASPWTVETNEDLGAIPDDEFDEYVDQHTTFADWDGMLGKAGEEHLSRKLGF